MDKIVMLKDFYRNKKVLITGHSGFKGSWLALTLFGLGEGLLIVSFTGASPWSVLAQGISLNVNLSVGTITFLISVGVLFLWIFLNQKPGIGTLLNALIIAVMIDLCITFIPTPSNYLLQIILAICSVIFVGIGGGIYLVANLGPGPRDGLMIGLQQITNLPIALVRALLEISVVTIGWYLGGIVRNWALCCFRIVLSKKNI